MWETTAALVLVVIGFVTYYLLPYSFVFRDIPLFLAILNSILLGMLMGLCVLSAMAQPLMERGLLWYAWYSVVWCSVV